MKPLFACVFSSLSFSDTSLRLDSPRRGGRRAKHLLESRGGKKMLNKKKREPPSWWWWWWWSQSVLCDLVVLETPWEPTRGPPPEWCAIATVPSCDAVKSFKTLQPPPPHSTIFYTLRSSFKQPRLSFTVWGEPSCDIAAEREFRKPIACVGLFDGTKDVSIVIPGALTTQSNEVSKTLPYNPRTSLSLIFWRQRTTGRKKIISNALRCAVKSGLNRQTGAYYTIR